MQIVTNNNNSVGALPNDWQTQVKTAIRDLSVLHERLDMNPPGDGAIKAANEFGLFVPESLLSRIEPGNPDDPILKQLLPIDAEMIRVDHRFKTDPVSDLCSSKLPGLIHKYPGRVLLICASTCPVHCRYCFRRHYPYQDRPRTPAEFEHVLQTISEMDGIDEVILSGGDPLMMVDGNLDWLCRQLDELPNLKRLRIHTRFPTIIPGRITDSLVSVLAKTRLALTIVLHVNHPNEIDSDVAAAIRKIHTLPCNVLNQSVLLRGINDNTDTLVALSEALININVIPYYLNQLDRVAGSQHFEVPIQIGRRLVREMRTRLPGYAVPRYVQDVFGHQSKHLLA